MRRMLDVHDTLACGLDALAPLLSIVLVELILKFSIFLHASAEHCGRQRLWVYHVQ
jgi:hypothetical protein